MRGVSAREFSMMTRCLRLPGRRPFQAGGLATRPFGRLWAAVAPQKPFENCCACHNFVVLGLKILMYFCVHSGFSPLQGATLARLFCLRSQRFQTASQGGFTLLEILIAAAIFALISAMAFGGLRSVLTARENTERGAARIAELQRALTWLGRDIEQFVGRSVRDEFGDIQPPFLGKRENDQKDGQLLELTHAGWRNPAQQLRSTLQRVAYIFKDDTLVRLSWNVLDRAQDSAPLKYDLLTGVQAISLRFLDDKLAWHDEWPPAADIRNNNSASLPRAVEWRIELKDWGEMTRLFRVPAFSQSSQESSQDGGGNGGGGEEQNKKGNIEEKKENEEGREKSG
jgi:general secretion pathway protein J